MAAAPVGLLDFASSPIEVLDADDVLDVVIAAERRIAAAQAIQMRALARFAELRPGGDPDNVMSEFAADEIAPALRLTRTSAMVRLDTATALTTRLPGTLEALEHGEIDLIKARAVVEATDPLSDEHAVAVQDQVLRRASTQTTSQLRASLRRAVLRVDPDGAAQRHEERHAHPKASSKPGTSRTRPATPISPRRSVSAS